MCDTRVVSENSVAIHQGRTRKKSMKPKLLLTIITFLVLHLTSCGVKAAPTIDPAQVQASAVVVLNTMIAMTQEAMPTETPVPPTFTPSDTPTTPPMPATATPASTAGAPGNSTGECNGLISANKGELMLKNLLINNKTKVVLGVSIYLNKNAFGDCGFWATPSGISANSSTTISNFFPSNSCYHVTAYTISGKPDFRVGNDFCVGSSGDKFALNITENGIGIVAP